jgi:hypothetical protein
MPRAHAEVCNWGVSGAKPIKCEGETYYYGSAACASGFYKGVFCHEKFYGDGRACADDNAPQTVRCYQKYIGSDSTPQGPPTPPQAKGEFCNWGFVGPKTYVCEGVEFCSGTAACGLEVYRGVFCQMKNCQHGRECRDDNDPITVRCHDKLLGPANGVRPVSPGWPSSSQSNGVAQ